MRSMRFLWAAAAACLLAVAAGLLLAGRGSAAASHPLKRPVAPRPSAPTLRPVSSENTVTTVQRTFVSATGSDSNPCTATAPCRSFTTALSKTTPGGEVVALTSGGYGPVGIGMAVTLVGAPGAHVAISVSSGDAIDVEAGSNDTVVLRNLYLNGIGIGTGSGINYTSGDALQLENVTTSGFATAGVNDQDPGARLYATDVDTRDNSNGVVVNPASGTAVVDLDGVRAEGNHSTGIFLAHDRGRLSDCISSGNGGDGVDAYGATMISGCRLSDNSYGLFVFGATVQLGGSTVTHNDTGLDNDSGTLQSFGDNLVAANTNANVGTITTISKT